jgi:hypothetical protein
VPILSVPLYHFYLRCIADAELDPPGLGRSMTFHESIQGLPENILNLDHWVVWLWVSKHILPHCSSLGGKINATTFTTLRNNESPTSHPSRRISGVGRARVSLGGGPWGQHLGRSSTHIYICMYMYVSNLINSSLVYSVLFYSILFCSILFCSILSYPIDLSIDPSIYLSIGLSIYWSIDLSTYILYIVSVLSCLIVYHLIWLCLNLLESNLNLI